MKDFNYKGVIFQAECEEDTGELVITAVYHRGEDITECLSIDTFRLMEQSLNA